MAAIHTPNVDRLISDCRKLQHPAGQVAEAVRNLQCDIGFTISALRMVLGAYEEDHKLESTVYLPEDIDT